MTKAEVGYAIGIGLFAIMMGIGWYFWKAEDDEDNIVFGFFVGLFLLVMACIPSTLVHLSNMRQQDFRNRIEKKYTVVITKQDLDDIEIGFTKDKHSCSVKMNEKIPDTLDLTTLRCDEQETSTADLDTAIKTQTKQ